MKKLIISFLVTAFVFGSFNSVAGNYPKLYYKLKARAQQQGHMSLRFNKWDPLNDKSLSRNFRNRLLDPVDGEDFTAAVNSVMLSELTKSLKEFTCPLVAYVNKMAPTSDCEGNFGGNTYMEEQNTPFIGDTRSFNERTVTFYSDTHLLGTRYSYRFSLEAGNIGQHHIDYPLYTYGVPKSSGDRHSPNKDDLVFKINMEILEINPLTRKPKEVTYQYDTEDAKKAGGYGLWMYVSIPKLSSYKGKSLKDGANLAVKNAKILLNCKKTVFQGRTYGCN